MVTKANNLFYKHATGLELEATYNSFTLPPRDLCMIRIPYLLTNVVTFRKLLTIYESGTVSWFFQ